jgi:enamine deaminase RidA (YjgF/YER057c/UK114 family)
MDVQNPAGWTPPVGCANGIAVDAGRIVFIVGQVGWDAQQKYHSEALALQFEQALRNVLTSSRERAASPNTCAA